MKIKISEVSKEQFKTLVGKVFGKAKSFVSQFGISTEINPQTFNLNIKLFKREFIIVFPKFLGRISSRIKDTFSNLLQKFREKFIGTKVGRNFYNIWDILNPRFKKLLMVFGLIGLLMVPVMFSKGKQYFVKIENYYYAQRPELVSSSISSGQKEVPLDQEFTITFSKSLSAKKLEQHLKGRSNLDLNVEKIKGKTFKVEIEGGLQPDKAYSIVFSDSKLLKNFQTINFETIKSPNIIATNAGSKMLPDEPILLSFNPTTDFGTILEQNPNFLGEVFEINPPIEGKVEMLTPSVLRFKNTTNYPYDTEIKFKVKKANIVNEYGLAMSEDFEKSFLIKSKVAQNTPVAYVEEESTYVNNIFRVYTDVRIGSKDPIKVALRNDSNQAIFEKNTQIGRNGTNEKPASFVWETHTIESYKDSDIFLDFYEGRETNFKLVTIYPSSPWVSGQGYELIIGREFRAEYVGNDLRRSINLIKPLQVSNTNIENGLLQNESYVYINFNNQLITKTSEAQSAVTVINKSNGKALKVNPYVSYNSVGFWGNFEPQVEYQITISSTIKDVYDQTLGQAQKFSFKVKQHQSETLPTFLDIYGQNTSFVENTGKHRILIESRRLNNIKVEAKKLTVDEYKMITDEKYDEQAKLISEVGKVVDTWTKSFDKFETDRNIRNSRVEFQYPFNNKEDGIYLVTAESEDGSYRSMKFIMLSKYVGVVKTSKNLGEALIWIIKAEDGSPAKNLNLNVIHSDGQKKTTTTNNDGVAIVNNIDIGTDFYVYDDSSSLYFEAGGSYGLGISYMDWDPSQESFESSKIGVYFDKPVYRPGNEFLYKVFSRDVIGNDLVPSKDPVSVGIQDSNGGIIYSDSVILNEFGTANNKFVLDDSLLGGEYSFFANGQYLDSFRIEDYEIFNFAFDLDTEVDKLYKSNDYVPIEVKGNYYFGEPLVNSKVEVNLYVRDVGFWSVEQFLAPEYKDFDFSNSFGYYPPEYASRKVGSLTLTTNEAGVAKGSVPLNIPADIRNEFAKLLSIEVKVVDSLGEEEYETVYGYVAPDSQFFGVDYGEYTVRKGETLKREIAHIGNTFQPISGSPMRVVYSRVEETQVKKKSLGGVYSWVSQTETIEEHSELVTTNYKGIAGISYTPKYLGNYKVEVFNANNTKPSLTFYFRYSESDDVDYYYDYSDYYNHNQNEIQIKTDKDSYAVGEKIKLSPELKSSKYIALETIEKKGVLSYKIIDLTKTPNLISEVPKEGHPNFYYSLLLISPRSMSGKYLEYKFGETNISVSEKDKILDVEILTDKPKYKPQEEVNLTVNLKSGDKPFTQDTELLVAVVDKAVLDLAKIDHNEGIGETLLNGFWTNWEKGVATSTNMKLYENKVIDEVEWGNKGGDGYGGDGGMRRGLEQEDIRKDFKEVALWLPAAYSKDGTFSTKFVVPDNLTTWEIVVIAITKDTQVGSNTSEIKVSKEASIVSGVPRFLVKGDEVDVVYDVRFDEEFRANLANASVEIQLEVEGMKVLCSEEQSDFCVRTIKIEDFPQQFRVYTQDSGQHKIRFAVFNGKDVLDAEEISIDVVPDTVKDEHLVLGMLDEDVPIEYSFPDKSIPESKYLEITLSSKPYSDLNYFADYFTNYAHLCSEQTSSRILGLLTSRDDEATKQVIQTGISRLYVTQNFDGGWGVWSGNDTVVYNTAYVLFALSQAEEFGFAVDSTVKEKAVKYLQEQSDVLRLTEGGTNTFIINVLAKEGVYMIDKLNRIYDQVGIQNMSGVSKIYMLESYMLYKQSLPSYRVLELKFVNGRIDSLKRDLYSKLMIDGKVAHWTNLESDNYYYYNNDVKTTAMAFDVLTQIDKKDSRLRPVLYYLREVMENRARLDTNTAYYVMSALETANDVYEVSLFGVVPQVTVNGEEYKLEKQDDISKLKIKLPDDSENVKIELGNSGIGNAYYEATIISERKYEDVKSYQDGFSIYSESELAAGTEIKKGDVYDQKIYIFVDEELGQIAVHNPVSAGTDIINFELARMSEKLADDTAEQNSQITRYFPQKSIRDEELLLYSSDSIYGGQLTRGIYVITFPVRATYSGKFRVLGEWAEEMYMPARSTHIQSETIEITY
jgi:alpha-2-macroglobulin